MMRVSGEGVGGAGHVVATAAVVGIAICGVGISGAGVEGAGMDIRDAAAGVSAIPCREAVVAEGVHVLSEVFIIVGDLEWGECIATAAVANVAH